MSAAQFRAAESFPPTPAAPGLARELVYAHLNAPDLSSLRRASALVISELVTNAVVHAHSVVDVELYVAGREVLLWVADFGRGTPAVREPDRSGGGYGLRIVGAIATAWGYEPLAPYGKRVWADLRE